MLQNIRDNAQGTVAKIIIGLIVVTFALFGVESIIGSLGGEPEVASVNGEAITEYQFQQQLERRRRQLINQMGENYDPSLIDENLLRSSTLENLIAVEVQRQVSEDKGLAVSEESIDQFILSWPPAQQDGRFSREQFQAVLRSNGLSPLEFRNELRRELLLGQMRSAIAQTAFILDSELEELLRIERQKRSFSYLELDAAVIAENIDTDAAAINEYYANNQADFEIGERVRVDYIEIKKTDLSEQVTVDESEIQARYDQEIEGFSTEEQRKVSHILLEFTDDVDKQELLAKAGQISDRAKAGESFAELAESESQDIGSAQNGGDLGFVNKGSLGDEIDEVLFAMETGEISEPIETDFGYHIIKLDEVSSVSPPTFEESRERIAAALRLEKAEDLFVEYSTKIADLTYSATDLIEPAKELGVSIKTSDPIARTGGDGIFSNPSVINQAFSEDVLEGDHNSEVVEINRDTLVVLRKHEFLPAQIQPLADVEKDIAQRLRLAAAKEKLAENTARLVESASNNNFDGYEGQRWQKADKVTRNVAEHGQAVSLAFGMSKTGSGVQVESFETDSGYIIVALSEIIDEDVQALPESEKNTLRTFLANRVGTQEYTNFTGQLLTLADVNRI